MRYGVTIYDDLYVMQNEHGLIKIGHSQNPEKRRRALEQTEHCSIALVMVLQAKGPREEAIHRRLERFRIEGEWFEGHADSRLAVEKVVNRGVPLEWPFILQDEAADAWLAELFERRDQRYRRGELQRFLRGERGLEPGRLTDAKIWQLYWLSETGEYPLVQVSGKDGETIVLGWRSEAEANVSILRYSLDMDAAMTLWPAIARPAAFEGCAMDCCMAALRLRESMMPRPIRTTLERMPKVEFTFPLEG